MSKSLSLFFSDYLNVYYGESGKVSAQPHTIVKQICFPNGNVLFLALFSLSKNAKTECIM